MVTRPLQLVLALLLVSLVPYTNSLSTVSISRAFDSQEPVICALTQQSHLNCTIQIPSGARNYSYSRIVGGKGFVCAVRSPPSHSSISIIGCWRFSDSVTPKFKRIYYGPALSELRSGNWHVCGIIEATKQIKCWQWRKFLSPFERQLEFSAVSVGDEFLCGLNASGNIICKGSNEIANSQIPTGNYTSIEAGAHYACALTAEGTPSCWGQQVVHAPEDEKFTSLALGANRACGLRTNGTVGCWGGNSNFTIPADAEFIAIEYKENVFCGVLSNFSLACWGSQISSSLTFDNVLPGACSNSSSCKCGVLPLPANFCGSGQSICSICPISQAPPPSTSDSTKKSDPWSGKMIAFLVVGIVGCISLATSILFWILLLRHQGNSRSSSRVHDSGRLDQEPEETNSGSEEVHRRPVLEKRLSHIVSLGSIEEFPLELLLKATNNFSNEFRIGTGSFGAVYKADLDDGRRVAIKRAEISVSTSNAASANKRNEERDTAFVAELGFLSKLNHKNLVRLLGFYEDAKERVLIYEYMTNGTLHDHLHVHNHHELSTWESPLMKWPGRIRVALDAARGIEYLHVYAVPPVIHRDIKPSNILLDDSWTARVSDFGLSLLGPGEEDSHLSLRAAGTLGYIDPEYYRRHQLTTKSDVYSFGVVLLELLTGLKAIHFNENGMPRNVVDFVIPYVNRDEIHRVLDPKMESPTPVEIVAVARVGRLAAQCVSLESRDRPSMQEIVGSLEAAWRVAHLAPDTFFSSPANSSYDED